MIWLNAREMGKDYEGFVDQGNNWFVALHQDGWHASGRYRSLGTFATATEAREACAAAVEKPARRRS